MLGGRAPRLSGTVGLGGGGAMAAPAENVVRVTKVLFISVVKSRNAVIGSGWQWFEAPANVRRSCPLTGPYGRDLSLCHCIVTRCMGNGTTDAADDGLGDDHGGSRRAGSRGVIPWAVELL